MSTHVVLDNIIDILGDLEGVGEGSHHHGEPGPEQHHHRGRDPRGEREHAVDNRGPWIKYLG